MLHLCSRMKQPPIHPAMQPYLDGKVILIDKPLEWTSFDAVKKIRILTRITKVGHAGTLDPLATGLLIICTGKYTKQINTYMGMPKTYTGSITLGATTPTYDLESEPQDFKPYEHITETALLQAAAALTGDIMQVPPIYSAIKQAGKPAYIKARKGEDVVLEPRPIHISSFRITHVALPVISFEIVCSTGTYIRSMAHDFGALLGVGGYLSSLRRTKIGDFDVTDALSLTDFEQSITEAKALWASQQKSD